MLDEKTIKKFQDTAHENLLFEAWHALGEISYKLADFEKAAGLNEELWAEANQKKEELEGMKTRADLGNDHTRATRELIKQTEDDYRDLVNKCTPHELIERTFKAFKAQRKDAMEKMKLAEFMHTFTYKEPTAEGTVLP